MSKSGAVRGAVTAWALVASAGCTELLEVDPGVPSEAAALHAQELVSVQSAWSGFEDAARLLITDGDAWAAAWETLYQGHSPVPELPAVDFQTHVVVLAAMGSRPTTGYSVSVESVRHHQGILYVSVLERSPDESCGTGQAITAPVHVVQVAREGATASFDVTRETYSC